MLTPVREFDWPAPWDIGELYTMTCKNHTFLRWSTKHPMWRIIHYLGLAHEVEVTKENAKYVGQECECPFEDLMVMED